MGTVHDSLPQLLRLARRSQGLTQELVAGRAGISTSALCRYEQGDLRALGSDTVRRLCGVLQVRVPTELGGEPGAAGVPQGDAAAGADCLYWCPRPFCPANLPFLLEAEVRFRPGLYAGRSGVESVCRYCETTLSSRCGGCDAPLQRHACVCPACGTSYVPPVQLTPEVERRLAFNREDRERVIALDADAGMVQPLDPAAVSRAGARFGAVAAMPGGGDDGQPA